MQGHARAPLPRMSRGRSAGLVGIRRLGPGHPLATPVLARVPPAPHLSTLSTTWGPRALAAGCAVGVLCYAILSIAASMRGRLRDQWSVCLCMAVTGHTAQSSRFAAAEQEATVLLTAMDRTRRRMGRSPSMDREVLTVDVNAYLDSIDTLPGDVIASFPDVSEMGHLNMTLAQWKAWVIRTAEQILTKLPPDRFAIFVQSDVKLLTISAAGDTIEEWVDKAFLLSLAAHNVGAKPLWHRVELLGTLATVKGARASYSHVLCFTRTGRCLLDGESDVQPRGPVAWVRGLGMGTCFRLSKFLVRHDSQRLVQLFCGTGAMLAAANYFGIPATGVELSPHRCRASRNATVESILSPKRTHEPKGGTGDASLDSTKDS